ncbi:hypothetical protein SCALIN_C45_0103 [Candidatus Scalindua japonica]|uniref:Polysaccharide chain length determinant N-terminal domain-containing protein n=1 Tax=Candidatus Scalindua japonica TaxID=1284222 RepID=A0A286U491_9BACT|nr:Wzz/FepE/Etk N-terminal domain-containing protein [Candidatus Scalindua japonica]GAX62945.1 hypothetical protein SCALIN_C45_0103 [Candidatus Scalindua japonica]
MEQAHSSFDLHKYTKLLLRKKWMWIIPTILCTIGSVFYATVQPDVYESECTLLVERSKVMDAVVGGQRGVSAKSVIQIVRQKMLSWKSLVSVIRILELDKDLERDDTAGLQVLYRKIGSKVRLKAKGRNLLTVSYRGENPEINFRIVDGLVTNFIESSLKDSRTEADETVEFVEEDLKRLKKNLDHSEEQLLAFEEEQLEDLPGSQNSKQVRLSIARKELIRVDRALNAINERIKYLDDLEGREDKTITGEVTRIPNPKVATLSKQIDKLEIEINTLRAKFFDEHPSIVKKLKVLKSLEEMREKVAKKVVSEEKIVNNPMYKDLKQKGFTAQLELKALQIERGDLIEEIALLEESVKAMPALRKKLSELKRGYNVNKQLFETRLMQKEKAELRREMTLDSRTNPYRIVDPARISYEPITVVKAKIVGMGFVLGLGLGIALILGLEQIDQRFKTMEDVISYMNLPALGMIPTIITNTQAKQILRKKIIVSSSIAGFIAITTVVCLVVEPVKTIVSKKASVGLEKLSKLSKK